MTTRLIADSEHMDHVTILLARVCAARLDATIKAEEFVHMVARLVDVAVAEAIEDHDSTPKRLRCMYCMQYVEGPHECERMRELGLTAPKANGTDTLLSDLGVIDNSTGAGAIAQRAEQHPAKATATEPPAAPSIAEPAPPRVSGDAGTPPAGPGAGEAGSHKLNGHRMTRQQIAALRSAYDVALDAHGGALPHGWQKEQARTFGFTTQAIGDRVKAWRREAQERVPDYVAGEELPHTETRGCWCRKKPNSRENVWCKLRRAEKPASQHAALRAPEPRVRRQIGTRY